MNNGSQEGLPITVIIHTLNEEVNLPHALNSVVGKFNQVFVVDSGSTDRTKEIALKYGADFIQRDGDRVSLVEQRNWALDTLKFMNEWVYILDADEQVPEDLYSEIVKIITENTNAIDGYWVRYKNIVLGKWLKRSTIYPNWNMRLFKHKSLRYENRSVNAHVRIDNERAGWIKAHFIHDDKKGFKAYVTRLASGTLLEARTVDEINKNQSEDLLKSSIFSSSPVERRRAMKKIYYTLPFRPLLMFVYLYFYKLGFLDGKAGFYMVLYRCLHETLINILKYEKELKK